MLGSEVLSTPASSSTVSPFRHGVASGDPLPDAVVLWTRVTPTEQSVPGSGQGPRVAVRWEVALDDAFTDVVRSGTVHTDAGRDHTVKLDATGLAPATDYWFRFTYADAASRTGRTRTAPAPGSTPERLRFGVVSCANWQAGWFNSYRHLAERGDLDAVIHLGDYLYEYQPGKYSYGFRNEDVRRHDPPREIVSLSDYRRRHAQYKTDRDLQALHAAVPFIVTWDDHEVADGSWAHGAYEHQAREGSYAKRVRAAQRAYDEWMPVRISGTAVAGDGRKIYRRLQFGQLVDLSMLDLRSYRSKRVDEDDPAINDSGAHDRGGAPARLARRQPRDVAVPLEARRQPGHARAGAAATPAGRRGVRAEPDRQLHAAPVVGAQHRRVGRLSLGPPAAARPGRGRRHDRRRVPDRRRAHGVGQRRARSERQLVATELVCSSITSNNVDDFIGARPRTVSLDARGSDPDREPARTVRQPRRPRALACSR